MLASEHGVAVIGEHIEHMRAAVAGDGDVCAAVLPALTREWRLLREKRVSPRIDGERPRGAIWSRPPLSERSDDEHSVRQERGGAVEGDGSGASPTSPSSAVLSGGS